MGKGYLVGISNVGSKDIYKITDFRASIVALLTKSLSSMALENWFAVSEKSAFFIIVASGNPVSTYGLITQKQSQKYETEPFTRAFENRAGPVINLCGGKF